uniref:CBP80/20-dependent translation initiation factor isoform X2 n=1 Tax=Ciona intestinalis TaxID=7719 RepID=UPI00089DB806|nr:CBP80/20-dependent translation initiation factor isoform X2 [Ciona intestinalis]|eukprot:XP_018669733.1 CBP80/20-dependent translation initiation factor isoform X2 [Ciona intestinalis]
MNAMSHVQGSSMGPNEMFSSEICDLESFIDSYVGPDIKRTGSSNSGSHGNWSRTHSYDESPIGSYSNNQLGDIVTSQSTGAEVWGKKSGGVPWSNQSAGSQVRFPQNDWTSHRPSVQERGGYPSPQPDPYAELQPQWQNMAPPTSGYSQQSYQQYQNYRPQASDMNQMQPPQYGYEPQFYQDQHFMNQQQDPNEIQAIVSDLIRQNNINRPKQGLPAWVDTSRPPPPLPQPTHHMEPRMQQEPQLYYAQNFQDQEEILHSMTFERSGQNPPRQQPTEFQMRQPSDNNGVYNVNRGNGLGNMQPAVNEPHSSDLVKTGKQTTQNKQNNEQIENMAESKKSETKSGLVRRLSDKYPNSKLRSSTGSESNDTSMEKSPLKPLGPPAQTQGVNFNRRQQRNHRRAPSNEVFESEYDEGWKTQNIQVHINNKLPGRHVIYSQPQNRRRSSAADEDKDWRRKSGDSPDKVVHNVKPPHEGRIEQGPESQQDRTNQTQRGGKNDKKSQNNKVEQNTRQVVAAQSKFKVQSWIEGSKSHDNTASKEIEKLRISDSEDDLLRFIQMTQSFATTESKMREVADILCNKALKNPKFGKNAAILCSRMSHLMVHGTKFRSVVLSVMQGHHKNRDRLFLTSLRGDTRWFGFATFLVELFVIVRTKGKERMTVLVDPVFSTLLQVLTGEKSTSQQVDCFRDLFFRCAPALEAENPTRFSNLMSEIRDCCVISKTIQIRQSLLQCVHFYATKWQV